MKTYDSRANLHTLRGLERSRIISVATVFRGMFHLILKDLVICLFGRSFMKDFVDGHNICFCLRVLLLQISKVNSLNINISLLLSKCKLLHRFDDNVFFSFFFKGGTKISKALPKSS